MLVDLFDREPWPESKMNEIFAGDASFLEWRAKKTSPEAFEKAKNRLMGFADHLRTQGYAKVLKQDTGFYNSSTLRLGSLVFATAGRPASPQPPLAK